MSWDVIIIALKDDVTFINGFPSEDQVFLGARDEIIKGIKKVIPNVDFSNPTWGIYDDGGISIEFNMGKEDPCNEIMLHVRGDGDPLFLIQKICDENNWFAFDTTDGSIIKFNQNNPFGFNSLIQSKSFPETNKSIKNSPPDKKRWWQFWK